METKNIDLTGFQNKDFDFGKNTNKINIREVFGDNSRNYIHELHLFAAHFNSIPNLISEIKINCTKANLWFVENYKTEIKDVHFIKRYFNGSKQSIYDDIFYFLYEDLLVDFDNDNSIVLFLFRQTAISKVEDIIKTIKKLRKEKKNTSQKSTCSFTQKLVFPHKPCPSQNPN